MEILLEIALAVGQFLLEILLQVALELLAELGLRGVEAAFRGRRARHPGLAGFGHALLGAAAGGLSLWPFPHSFIQSPGLRVANLLVTPLVAGGVAGLFGFWRQRQARQPLRFDRFGNGFWFAFTATLVRFAWTDQP